MTDIDKWLSFAADDGGCARERLYAAMRQHCIEVSCRFLPFGQSPCALAGWRFSDYRLCWAMTVHVMNKPVLTTDYAADISHCRAYRRPLTSEIRNEIMAECDTGSDAYPDPADALGGLLDDASLVRCGFEVWAEEHGLDPDSRLAEAAWRDRADACMKLRHCLGDAAFAELEAAAGL